MRKRKKGWNVYSGNGDYPTVSQGAEGLAFVEACLESNQNGNTWVEFRRK